MIAFECFEKLKQWLPCMISPLFPFDSELAHFIEEEKKRQQTTLSLIASENYVDKGILQAVGSVLTNKYAEGYPGKRYYAGCAVVDQIELLAQERCKTLFGAQHANVQPHAGSQANMAVYYAALRPGDTILGMSLAHGGHLTHGHSVNFSGIFYKTVAYGVDQESEQIDYDKVQKLAEEHKPALLIAGASAYSRIIDFERCAAIAASVNALFLADIAHIAGLVAAQLHPSPVPYADFVSSTTHKTLRGPRGGVIMSKLMHASALDRAIMPGTQGGPFMNVIAAKAACFYEAAQPAFSAYQRQVIKNAQAMANAFHSLGYRIVSGGTDNHLFIVDLRSKKITGLQAERYLELAGITTSRSCIPFDPQKPWITSGLRIGTPAVTTRGLEEDSCQVLVALIDQVLSSSHPEKSVIESARVVKSLCEQFPVPLFTAT